MSWDDLTIMGDSIPMNMERHKEELEILALWRSGDTAKRNLAIRKYKDWLPCTMKEALIDLTITDHMRERDKITARHDAELAEFDRACDLEIDNIKAQR